MSERICRGFEYAGIYLDAKANYEGSGERVISSPYSPIKVMVIPTNEELIMARDPYCIVQVAHGADVNATILLRSTANQPLSNKGDETERRAGAS